MPIGLPISGESAFCEVYELTKQESGLPVNFESLFPMGRIIAILADRPGSQHPMRFLSAVARADILQAARLTAPSMESGASCYLAIFSLLRSYPSPPANSIVRQRGALFPNGREFGLYSGHLMKTCRLSEIVTARRGRLFPRHR